MLYGVSPWSIHDISKLIPTSGLTVYQFHCSGGSSPKKHTSARQPCTGSALLLYGALFLLKPFIDDNSPARKSPD